MKVGETMNPLLQHDSSLLANVKLHLRTAQYTRVGSTWHQSSHYPTFNRLYYICDGEGIIEIDGHTYYPKVGDLVILPAKHKIQFDTISTNTFLKYWCHLDATLGDNNVFDILNLPFVVQVKDYSAMVQLFKKLINCHTQEDLASAMMVKAYLHQLLAVYIKEGSASSTDQKIYLNEQMSHILHYIHKYLSEDLNNELLAKELNFHPNHFIRFFKASIGMSPMKYIKKQRMKRAEFMLIASNLDITEISTRLGYKNIYHFSKAFKQYFGYSPTDYRQQYMKQANNILPTSNIE